MNERTDGARQVGPRDLACRAPYSAVDPRGRGPNPRRSGRRPRHGEPPQHVAPAARPRACRSRSADEDDLSWLRAGLLRSRSPLLRPAFEPRTRGAVRCAPRVLPAAPLRSLRSKVPWSATCLAWSPSRGSLRRRWRWSRRAGRRRGWCWRRKGRSLRAVRASWSCSSGW